MYTLAIDTATNMGGVALCRNAEIVSVWICGTPLRYSDRIIDWIDYILRERPLKLREIDLFATATGPGSFTGIRVGLASVKALAQAMGRPLIGIPTLAALAARFRAQGGWIAPLIDARRQQIFGGVYDVGEPEVRTVREPEVAKPADWLGRLPDRRCLFVGDGAEFYRGTVEAIRPLDVVFPSDNQIAGDLCRLAYIRHTRGLSSRPEEVHALYVRPSDAELGRTAGAGGER